MIERCGQNAAALLCEEDTRQTQAAKNRRKKSLASVSGFCKSVIVTSLLLQFQFLKARLTAGFLFLVHRNPSDSGKRERAETP